MPLTFQANCEIFAFACLTAAILICSGSFKKRLAILRMAGGIVAENNAICVVSGK